MHDAQLLYLNKGDRKRSKGTGSVDASAGGFSQHNAQGRSDLLPEIASTTLVQQEHSGSHSFGICEEKQIPSMFEGTRLQFLSSNSEIRDIWGL